jgi:uncharacterized protein
LLLPPLRRLLDVQALLTDPVSRRRAIGRLDDPIALAWWSQYEALSAGARQELAAPILNPVVLLATAIAYRGRDVMWPMVLGRAGLGLVVAMAVGWAVGGRARGTNLLRGTPSAERRETEAEGKWPRYFGHLADDFTMLARYLVIGAGVAAALQTFLPQDVIGSVATTPILDVVALMVLAAALSLCSESDAFVAASFVQFGMASQLAFLVAGPMIDAKLVALYGGTFERGFVRTVAIVVFATTLAGSLWIQVAFG